MGWTRSEKRLETAGVFGPGESNTVWARGGDLMRRFGQSARHRVALGSATAYSGIYIPTDTGLPDPSCSTGPVACVLSNVMLWLLGILGFLAIIAFVIAGLMYLFSAGDEKMIGTAKSAMIYAVIGVVVALSGYIVIQAVTRALEGTPMF